MARAAVGRRLLVWVALLYGILCLAALGIAAIGVLGNPSQPFASLFAIVLAMPWSLLLGPAAATGSSIGNLGLLFLCMLLNAAILFLLRRILAPNAGKQDV